MLDPNKQSYLPCFLCHWFISPCFLGIIFVFLALREVSNVSHPLPWYHPLPWRRPLLWRHPFSVRLYPVSTTKNICVRLFLLIFYNLKFTSLTMGRVYRIYIACMHTRRLIAWADISACPECELSGMSGPCNVRVSWLTALTWWPVWYIQTVDCSGRKWPSYMVGTFSMYIVM